MIKVISNVALDSFIEIKGEREMRDKENLENYHKSFKHLSVTVSLKLTAAADFFFCSRST